MQDLKNTNIDNGCYFIEMWEINSEIKVFTNEPIKETKDFAKISNIIYRLIEKRHIIHEYECIIKRNLY